MRLIDADALKDKCYITVRGTTIGRKNYVMFHEIDDAPTIDAEPVKHGEWEIDEAECIYGKKYIITCSECGESVSVTEAALPYEKYCRNCGAKMNGGKK